MKLKKVAAITVGILFGMASLASAHYHHSWGCSTSGSTTGTESTPDCTAGDTITHTFSPNREDLWNLPHGYYFDVGIGWDIPTNEVISTASITFNNIRNWDTSSNALFVNLLDDSTVGTHGGTDYSSGEYDYFDSVAYTGTHTKIDLMDYFDLSTTAQTLTYDFTAPDLLVLNNYLADGVFGLGIDPDCHFYNTGIVLQIETICQGGGGGTSPVPEPTTMLLFSTGLAGLAGFQSQRKKKRS